MTRLRELRRGEDGQDLVEYSLLLAFIALAAVLLLSGVGRGVSGIWSSINSKVATVPGASGAS